MDRQSQLWPTPQDYNEAIQSPRLCFDDSDLRAGRVATNAIGLPKAASGSFASVYKVTTPTGDWAVRCFLTARRDQGERYRLISEYILFDDLEYTVDFHYIEKGIKVGGLWYPIVKMPWIEGPTLDVYISKIIGEGNKLLALRNEFYAMSMALENAGIAHGDLQHGNIIVSPNGLRLVDYDAFFVPSLQGRLSLEYGHPNYQHPLRDEYYFDVTVDNFSSWLIYASIVALTIDPALFELLEGGDDSILFKRTDLRSPEQSKVFASMLSHDSPILRELGDVLLRMLWVPPHIVPALNATAEELAKLPREKTESWNLQGFSRVDDFYSSPSKFTDNSMPENLKASRPSADLAPKRVNKKKNSLKSKAVDVLNSAFKTASPSLWISINRNEGERLLAAGSYDKALERFLQVRDLQRSAFPDEPHIELIVLLRLIYCSINLDAINQAENFCTNAAQIAHKNAKLLSSVSIERLYTPGLTLFYIKLSDLLGSLGRRTGEKSESLSTFEELLSQGAEIATTIESQQIVVALTELFSFLIMHSRLNFSTAQLRQCAESVLKYQGTWGRANGKFPIAGNEQYWRKQVAFIELLAKFVDDDLLLLRSAIMSKSFFCSRKERPADLFYEWTANPILFSDALQACIGDAGLGALTPGLFQILESAEEKSTSADYVTAVRFVWEIVLKNQQESLASKIEFLRHFKSDKLEMLLKPDLFPLVLEQMRNEFALEQRMQRVRQALVATWDFKGGEKLRAVMTEELYQLTMKSKDELSDIDLSTARSLIGRFATDGSGLAEKLINTLPERVKEQ